MKRLLTLALTASLFNYSYADDTFKKAKEFLKPLRIEKSYVTEEVSIERNPNGYRIKGSTGLEDIYESCVTDESRIADYRNGEKEVVLVDNSETESKIDLIYMRSGQQQALFSLKNGFWFYSSNDSVTRIGPYMFNYFGLPINEDKDAKYFFDYAQKTLDISQKMAKNMGQKRLLSHSNARKISKPRLNKIFITSDTNIDLDIYLSEYEKFLQAIAKNDIYKLDSTEFHEKRDDLNIEGKSRHSVFKFHESKNLKYLKYVDYGSLGILISDLNESSFPFDVLMMNYGINSVRIFSYNGKWVVATEDQIKHTENGLEIYPMYVRETEKFRAFIKKAGASLLNAENAVRKALMEEINFPSASSSR